MRLKKCAFCRKDIPTAISICPYCRRDENGLDAELAQEHAAAANDPAVLLELKQLGSDDPHIQKETSDRLLQRGPAAVPSIIHFLNEHPQKGAAEAARILGRLRDRRSVDTLLGALKMGAEDTRMAAVWALGQLNEPQALNELLRESERADPAVQGYLARILAGYQDPRIIPALIKLSGHTNRDVAFQAIWSLGEVGDISAIKPLRRLLGRKDPILRAAAETGLKRLGGPLRRLLPVWVYIAGGVVSLLVLGGAIWQFYK